MSDILLLGHGLRNGWNKSSTYIYLGCCDLVMFVGESGCFTCRSDGTDTVCTFVR